jgi:Tfp pilus assembly protein FimT
MKTIFNKGISLIEIIIIIAIISTITAITIPNLSSFRNQREMINTKEDIIALLNEARNSTISSKNSTNYGVHIQTDRAILFPGDIFVDSTENKQVDFDSSVNVPSTGGINLSGGGDDIVFERLTGNTENHGTIIIQLTSDSSVQKTITISSLGIISSD